MNKYVGLKVELIGTMGGWARVISYEGGNLFKLAFMDCDSSIIYATLDEIMVLP